MMLSPVISPRSWSLMRNKLFMLGFRHIVFSSPKAICLNPSRYTVKITPDDMLKKMETGGSDWG